MLGRRQVIGSKGHVGDLARMLKLHDAGRSQRQIAAELKLSKGVVQGTGVRLALFGRSSAAIN